MTTDTPRTSPLSVEIGALTGGSADLAQYAGKAVLVVNVASKCGLTPQYTGLEALQARYAEQGFTVLGVPCNQFLGQEPGSAEEIAEFCSATYGVTFPMTEKVEVNGEGRHALYERLVGHADAAPEPDPAEVAATEWMSWRDLAAAVLEGRRDVSVWCREQVGALRELGPGPDAWPTADPAELPPALPRD